MVAKLRRHSWTDEDDTRMRVLRAQGMPWDEVATTLEVTIGAAHARGERIGITGCLFHRVQSAVVPPPPPPPPMAARLNGSASLPAGATWDLIVAGTLLEGMPWPGE